MNTVTRGKVRMRHYAGGVALDIGGLAYGCPAGGLPFIVIESADLDDAIAALQALRPASDPGPGARTCPGCGAETAMWACEGCGVGHRIEELDNTMRCAACRAKSGLPPTMDQSRYAPVTVPPDVLAAAERTPASSEFVYRSAGRRPIERYVRAAVAIPGSKGRIDGTIEIGLHYERGDPPHAYRDKLIEVGEVSARVARGRTLDEDTADLITADLDERIVHLWGDRPRFIEIWRGTGEDAEPLTQLYAPHGMPIARKP